MTDGLSFGSHFLTASWTDRDWFYNDTTIFDFLLRPFLCRDGEGELFEGRGHSPGRDKAWNLLALSKRGSGVPLV